MAEEDEQEGWIEHKKIPFSVHRFCASKTKPNHITCLSQKRSQSYGASIHKYNIDKHEWKKIISSDAFPNDHTINGTATGLCIDDENNTLYAKLGESGLDLLIIHMDTKEMKIKAFPNFKEVELGYQFGFIFAEDTIHIIGGSKSSKHYAWNINDKDWKEIHDFNVQSIFSPCLVYSRTSGLLLIGMKSKMSSERFRDIKRFYSSSQKWDSANVWQRGKHRGKIGAEIAFCSYHVSAAIVSGGDYIIIAGGYERDKPSDKIFVLDMKEDSHSWKFYESHVKLPVARHCQIASTTVAIDKGIVYAYIRRLYRSMEFENVKFGFPSMDVIGCIGYYYNEEILHWLIDGYKYHYSIGLNAIMKFKVWSSQTYTLQCIP